MGVLVAYGPLCPPATQALDRLFVASSALLGRCLARLEGGREGEEDVRDEEQDSREGKERGQQE